MTGKDNGSYSGCFVKVLYNSLSLSLNSYWVTFTHPTVVHFLGLHSPHQIHQTSSPNQSSPKVFIFVILVVPWSWSLSSGAQGWDCHSFHDFQALLTTCNKTTTTRNNKSLLRGSEPSLFANKAGFQLKKTWFPVVFPTSPFRLCCRVGHQSCRRLRWPCSWWKVGPKKAPIQGPIPKVLNLPCLGCLFVDVVFFLVVFLAA